MSNETKQLTARIALDKLICAKVTSKNGSECLMIPIKQNNLEVDDYGIHLPLRLTYKPIQDDKKQNGFISKAIGSETYKNASEEQKEAWKDFSNEDTKKQTPILGNIKDWSSGGVQQTSDVAKGAAVDPDADDLPF